MREIQGLGPGALARAGHPFLLEEGPLRAATIHDELDATRAVPLGPDALQAEHKEISADLSRRQVYFVVRKDNKRGDVTIGRTKDCDVRLPTSSVSKKHAVIANVEKNRWTIRDLGSKNGTFIEGQAVTKGLALPLPSGTLVRFGPEVRLTFLDGDAMERLLRQLDPVLRQEKVQPQELPLPSYLDEDEETEAGTETKPALAEKVREALSEKIESLVSQAKQARSHAPRAPEPANRDEDLFALVCPPFAPVRLVTGSAVSVGRDAANDLILPHPQVSRRHARFERSGDTVLVTDLDSANGTWIADRRIARQPVKKGAEVVIGPYRIAVKHLELPGTRGCDMSAEPQPTKPQEGTPRPWFELGANEAKPPATPPKKPTPALAGGTGQKANAVLGRKGIRDARLEGDRIEFDYASNRVSAVLRALLESHRALWSRAHGTPRQVVVRVCGSRAAGSSERLSVYPFFALASAKKTRSPSLSS